MPDSHCSPNIQHLQYMHPNHLSAKRTQFRGRECVRQIIGRTDMAFARNHNFRYNLRTALTIDRLKSFTTSHYPPISNATLQHYNSIPLQRYNTNPPSATLRQPLTGCVSSSSTHHHSTSLAFSICPLSSYALASANHASE